jgi:formate/nitrite transporter FocA (FNT family)
MHRSTSDLKYSSHTGAAYIKELAAQLQETVTALEQAASIAEAKLHRAVLFCLAAGVASALSLCVSVFLLFSR